jgi:hypothetical protein
MSLASRRVIPCEAVTRSVVMTSRRRVAGERNWTSREVTIPIRVPPRSPVSLIERKMNVSDRNRQSRE